MGRLIFVTGGARSGKSRYAVERAKRCGGKAAFVATCVPRDDEMRSRVEAHKSSRPADWTTLETETGLAALLRGLQGPYDAVIVDCLTLFVSNLLLAGRGESQITKEIQAVLDAVRVLPATVLMVSNEVGSGIVPDNELARRFRDAAGTANQMTAQQADEVIFMVSGIPLTVKKDAS
jgi:adenosylcobinamide kinase/adenosylcobinamide-phosphate guanylyltransferase